MKNNLISGFAILCVASVLTGCNDDDGFHHDPSSPIVVESFLPESGGGGTEILITGDNFSEDPTEVSVTINGHPLAIINSNSKQIMAVVPKKADTGPVVVTIRNRSGESASSFHYVFTRTVTTLAGSGTAGFANGKGTDAMFNFCGEAWYRSCGIAVDENLNLYVADPGNHCIRKIDSLGNVTTLAGDPSVSGYQDGQGSSALFSLPYDVAIDDEGNVYSADPGNWDIRKITPNGTASTIAWGAQAPWSISYDPETDKVYYSSCSSPGNIYRITEQWVSDKIIGDLNYPAGIEFDNDGNLFVSVHGDHVIKKYTSETWESSVVAGQAGTSGYLNGSAGSAKFALPWGITVDHSGNLYVAGNGTWNGATDHPDQSIRFIKSGTWEVTTFAGSGSAGYADAIGEAAAFSAPTGVAVDKNGTVYVLDKNNNRIRKIVSE